MTDKLALFAHHYHKLGLNVTRMSNTINVYNFYNKNLLKTPDHEFKQWFSTRQTPEEFNSLDWSNATGVGVTAGFEELVVIDLDGSNDYALLDEFLDCLQLPRNYEWVTVSGSNNGFHIIVFAHRYDTFGGGVVTTFKPNANYNHRFEKVELLWKTNVVLPPSMHNTGMRYEFLNCNFPSQLPSKVSNSYLNLFAISYLDVQWIEGHDDYTSTDFRVNVSNTPSDLMDFDYKSLPKKGIACIIDIETDGLIVKASGGNKFPKIVQVAWLLMDAEGTVHKKYSSLLLGDFNYENDAFKTNKISSAAINTVGNDQKEVLKLLLADLKVSDYAVFHNSDFDSTILRTHFNILGLQDIFINKKIICTMRQSTDFCALRNEHGGYKFPKLIELYERLFGYEVIQQHNAESDVLITAKCFRELAKRGIMDL